MVDRKCVKNENCKIISVGEKGKKYVARNPNNHSVIAYCVDNCLVTGCEVCDFLCINRDNRVMYFIECKGRDVPKACSQINATIKMFSCDGYSFGIEKSIIKARIVSSKNRTMNLKSLNYRKLEQNLKKHNGRFDADAILIKTRFLEELIS